MTYTIAFRRTQGCHLAIVQDMARYDGAEIVSTTTDDTCEPECVRTVTLHSKKRLQPTMARWASFMLGAHKV